MKASTKTPRPRQREDTDVKRIGASLGEMEIFRLHILVMAPLGDDYILSSSVGALSGIQGNPVLLNDPHYTILLWKT